jgi:hypothetical protein
MNKNITLKNMGSDIKLVAGTSHPELAAEVSAHLGIPLSGRDIVRFPNENIFVRLHETVRGQDAYVIQSMCPPVSAARSAIKGVIPPPTALRAAPGSPKHRGCGIDGDHPARVRTAYPRGRDRRARA